MPILGINLPEAFVERQREVLRKHIAASEKLKQVFPGASFILKRKPYTGDYSVWAMTSSPNSWYPVAKFGMLPLPGCRAICVFHHVETEPMLQHRGIGTELLRIRMVAAKEIGYKQAVCTVRIGNLIENAILARAGFRTTSWLYSNKDNTLVSMKAATL